MLKKLVEAFRKFLHNLAGHEEAGADEPPQPRKVLKYKDGRVFFDYE